MLQRWRNIVIVVDLKAQHFNEFYVELNLDLEWMGKVKLYFIVR